MGKIYSAVFASCFGALSLSPAFAQSSQDTNQVIPQSEIQTSPTQFQDNETPVLPRQEEGLDTNVPSLEGTIPGVDTTTEGGSVADYQQYPEYSQLQSALQQQPPDWEAADRNTYALMLRIAGANSQNQGSFQIEEWNQFPCNALQDIDQLWMQASMGEQGFSRQWNIFQSARPNQNLYYYRIGWKELSGAWKVAWRIRDNRLEYVQNASPNFTDPPLGHLPAGLEWQDGKDRRFQAVDRCNLNQ